MARAPILLFFSILISLHANAADVAAAKVRQWIQSTTSGDEFGTQARKNLESLPSEVTEKLARTWLTSNDTDEQALGIRLVQILELRTLAPEAFTLAKTSQSMTVHAAIRKLAPQNARKEWISFYEKRLRETSGRPESDMYRLYITDTLIDWKATVSAQTLQLGLSDALPDLRVSSTQLLVQNLKLKSEIGKDILLKASVVRPVQARRVLWNYWASLSALELKGFDSVLQSHDCASDQKLRELCEKVKKKRSEKTARYIPSPFFNLLLEPVLKTGFHEARAMDFGDWTGDLGSDTITSAPLPTAPIPAEGDGQQPPASRQGSPLSLQEVPGDSHYKKTLEDVLNQSNDRLIGVRKMDLPCLNCLKPWVISPDMDKPEKSEVSNRLEALNRRQRQSLNSCKKKYDDIYSKPEVDIRVALGYFNDDDGEVVDKYARVAMVKKLTEHCPSDPIWTPEFCAKEPETCSRYCPSNPKNCEVPRSSSRQACGFKVKDPDDLFSPLVKTVRGPDGKPREVKVSVVNASSTGTLEGDRNNPEQAEYSRRAKENFYEGLKSAQVVLYAGHSRKGGGIDFDVAHTYRERENGKIKQMTDYGFYQRHRPGYKEMLGAMKPIKKGPAIVGLFSCISGEHFAAAMKKGLPGSGFIFTERDRDGNPDRQYYETQVGQIFATIDSVLAQQCQEAFNQAFKKTSVWYGQSDLPVPYMENVF